MVLIGTGLAALGASPAAAATGTVSGTVTAAGGGALEGICVGAFTPGADPPVQLAVVTTGADGTYSLGGVPTGNVDVEFTGSAQCPGGIAHNVVNQWYSGQTTEATATHVTVSGTPATGIDAAMVAGGSISGKVTAASGGAGLAGICVNAYIPGADATLVASASTTSGGNYTVTGVPAGNVEVQFSATGFCPGGTEADYAAQWYNNRPDEASAGTVPVTAGGTTPNINAALLAAGSIHGTVTAAAGGASLSGICVEAFTHGIDPPQMVASIATVSGGTYALTGVPVGQVDVQFNSSGFCPGGTGSHYVTQWYNNKSSQSAANAVTVTAGATVSNINAALAGGGSISGTVTAAAGGAPLNGICVVAFSTGANSEQVALTGTLPNGTYVLDGVPAGSVQVEFNASGSCPGGSAANYVTQWFNNQPLQTTAANVTVTNGVDTPNVDAAMVGGGSISGVVTSAGTGVGGICVDAYVDEALVTSVATNANGTYTLPGVPAGPAQVQFNSSGVCPGGVAGNFVTQWWQGAATEAAATTVTVTAGGTKTNINAAMVENTSFTIKVNGGSLATIAFGAKATLSASGIPGPATGTVVFSAPGHNNLCTITLPATSCQTSASLGVSTYSPISAAFNDTSGAFTDSTSTNTVALTVSADLPSAPTNVHATQSGGTVTVTWTAPSDTGGSSLTTYTVAPSKGAARTVAAPATQAKISGLAAGTYTFVVTANNSLGAGVPSAASNAVVVPRPVATARTGYWMLGVDGHVYNFGNASRLGNASGAVVALTPTLDGRGYWVVDLAGRVSHFGSAGYFGGRPHLNSGEVVTTISATPSAKGYWLFTNLGRVFAYGDAHFYGDMRATKLNGSIIASSATATGKGYYLVGSDGGVFSFGDAKFHGSTGNMRLNQPVVGIAPTPDNKGYWLVASDGGVFAFHAAFRGSMGAVQLQKPVNGLVAFGNGYLMVASDGGVFNFSNKPFLGSLGMNPPAAPIIGIAAFATN